MTSAVDQLIARRKAKESISELYDVAARIAELHEAAGMRLPDEVAALLGAGDNKAKPRLDLRDGNNVKTSWKHGLVACPYQRPPEVPQDWMSIAAAKAGAMTLLRHALYGEAFPVDPKTVMERVSAFDPTMSTGTLWNTAVRLKDFNVQIIDGKWRLKNPTSAPMLHEDRLWGPVDSFQKIEIASHRREAALELLRRFAPLGRAEIIAGLRSAGWVYAPVNETLVRNDLDSMRDQGLVTRDNDTWLWSLAKKGSVQLRLA